MEKTCQICGHKGELTWRDNQYYCSCCGSIVEVTQQEPQSAPVIQSRQTLGVQVVCPICKNDQNNYLQDGQFYCSMCGSAFNAQQSNVNPSVPNTDYYVPRSTMSNARREALEKEKNDRLIWGIVWVFLFWPIAVYHFYKLYKVTQELKG